MEKSNIKAVRITVKRNLVIFFLFVLCESFSTYERGGHNLLTVSMLDKSLTLFLLGGGGIFGNDNLKQSGISVVL